MQITKYEQIGEFGEDMLKEIGNIGTGTAATAISDMIGAYVRTTVIDVDIMSFSEAIYHIGDPESQTLGILSEMTGEMDGVMMYLCDLDFANTILGTFLQTQIENFSELQEMEQSALIEVGNIIISSYVSALSSIANVEIDLSVPVGTVDMLGGILNAPMVEVGYETDKIMIVSGKFIIDEKVYESSLLMVPTMKSLNILMRLLGSMCE